MNHDQQCNGQGDGDAVQDVEAVQGHLADGAAAEQGELGVELPTEQERAGAQLQVVRESIAPPELESGSGSWREEPRRSDAELVAALRKVVTDPDTAASVARNLAEPLLDSSTGVRGLQVRLSRLTALGSQAPLFPEIPGVAGRH